MSSGVQLQIGHRVLVRSNLLAGADTFITKGMTGLVTRIDSEKSEAHVHLAVWPHWTIAVPLNDLVVIQ